MLRPCDGLTAALRSKEYISMLIESVKDPRYLMCVGEIFSRMACCPFCLSIRDSALAIESGLLAVLTLIN